MKELISLKKRRGLYGKKWKKKKMKSFINENNFYKDLA
jgi:hypothetical protein